MTGVEKNKEYEEILENKEKKVKGNEEEGASNEKPFDATTILIPEAIMNRCISKKPVHIIDYFFICTQIKKNCILTISV